MINYKLRLFTPCSSYGAKEMAPKSQLRACSFQDSLRQKNWALEQIRKFPDTIRYVWTAENDSNTLRVDAKILASAKKYLRKKKFPDTCGHGLRLNKRTRDLILWLDLFAVNIFLRLTVKIILSFLRLTAKFLAVLRLTVNPIEILLYAQFCLNQYKTGRHNALPL